MSDDTKKETVSDVGTVAGADEAASTRRSSREITFAEFLETTPPSQMMKVSDLFAVKRTTTRAIWYEIASPELKLHCESDICNGLRVFRFHGGDSRLPIGMLEKQTYLIFVCSNCRKTRKMYSLYASHDAKENSTAGNCYKFGEVPPFGTQTPNRVLRLFGTDAKVFLKGRQCENHALGVGAFSYYRRVVESHKDQIFDEIIKVTRKIAPDIVASLETAKREQQFLKAIERVKDAIPQGLLINGHNPLTLLHSALSEGLHAQTDEQCLEAAHDIRVVLTALVQRLNEALRDEAELNASIERLARRKSSS